MALDQVELEQQRLDLGGGDGHLDARDLPTSTGSFPRARGRGNSWRRVLQVPRLAT